MFNLVRFALMLLCLSLTIAAGGSTKNADRSRVLTLCRQLAQANLFEESTKKLDYRNNHEALAVERKLLRISRQHLKATIEQMRKGLPRDDADRWYLTYALCWLKSDYIRNRNDLLAKWQRGVKSQGRIGEVLSAKKPIVPHGDSVNYAPINYVYADSSIHYLYALYLRTHDRQFLKALIAFPTVTDGALGEELDVLLNDARRLHRRDFQAVSTNARKARAHSASR